MGAYRKKHAEARGRHRVSAGAASARPGHDLGFSDGWHVGVAAASHNEILTGIIVGVSDAPQDISFDEMVRRQHKLLDVVARDPDVESYGTGLGGSRPINNGFVRLFLKDKSERTRTQAQIADDLQGLTRRFTAARVNVTQEASIGERRSNQSGVQFVVQAADFAALKTAAEK